MVNFFQTVAIVLSLAGAPANSNITCSAQPLLPFNGQSNAAMAITNFVTADDGTIVSESVLLSATLCHYLHSTYLPNRATALYGLLHEAEYLVMGKLDECGSDVLTSSVVPLIANTFFKGKSNQAKAIEVMDYNRHRSLVTNHCT